MADEFVSEERWQAGADYLASLQMLGFKPEAMLWMQRETTSEMVLAIVSRIVDRVGSTEIYNTLFKAYDHAVTPRSIDPWIVSVYSPLTFFKQNFDNLQRGAANIVTDFRINGEPIDFDGDGDNQIGMLGEEYTYKKSWVYIDKPIVMESRHQKRVWDNFKKNVDRKAA